jgi:signal transduction histidine kinase
VIADETHLRQALVNLLENAVKYSPDGGRVALELEARGGRLRFLVHDEGIGIPAADQRRIFDRFVRLDPQLSGGVSGTGLGLHITRGFVARMGGSLTVSSLPGRGSTFVVELPSAAS